MKAYIAELESTLNWLTEQVRFSQVRRFGASSEASGQEALEQMSLLFNEAEFHADEAVKALPKGAQTGAAVTGQAYCTKLFMIERELQGLAPERRYEERLKREKPLLDEFRAWADARTVAPKSKLGQAFVYLANQWTPLTNCLLDGRLEISNNRAERRIQTVCHGA